MSSINHCKTCVHWIPKKSDDWGAIRGAGECGKVPEIFRVTDTLSDEDLEYKVLKAEHAAVLAVVEDGSAYHARLITMPDFGCVQHAFDDLNSAPQIDPGQR